MKKTDETCASGVAFMHTVAAITAGNFFVGAFDQAREIGGICARVARKSVRFEGQIA